MIAHPALLLLDTCLLLDIIRAPVRENIGVHDISAIRTLVARHAADPKALIFGVTQQVRDEFMANVAAVEEETRRAIEKRVTLTNEMLASIAAFNSGIAIPAPMRIAAGDAVNAARAIADGILSHSMTILHTAEDSHAAMSRVLQALPPATQAKQSSKDCLILAGVLRHAATVSAQGGGAKMVFASSNTADYHQTHNSLHPLLRAEFTACGLGFAPSWSAARHELDRA